MDEEPTLLEEAEVLELFGKVARGTLKRWTKLTEKAGLREAPMMAAEDLVNDLWEWYVRRPNTQVKMAAEPIENRWMMVSKHAGQLLSAYILDDNLDKGSRKELFYSRDDVKAALKGESGNKLLMTKYLPDALERLEESQLDKNGKQVHSYPEVLRSRYEDGVVPEQGAPQTLLRDAIRAVSAHVNVSFMIDEDEVDRFNLESRPMKGGTPGRTGQYSDPTGNMALRMLDGHADERIELWNGFYTTMRSEMLVDDLAWANQGSGRIDTLSPSIFDSVYAADGIDMYRAQVMPDLYPNEKPMLLQNWHEEDLEAYCGGEYIKGYLRLVK
jgi:hypothetical protein